jgi:hypothetical protein
MGFIFDIIDYTGLFENAVQNGLGKDGVERGWGYGGVVGSNTGNDDSGGEE